MRRMTQERDLSNQREKCLTCNDDGAWFVVDEAFPNELKSPKSDSSVAGFAESKAPKSAKSPLPVAADQR